MQPENNTVQKLDPSVIITKLQETAKENPAKIVSMILRIVVIVSLTLCIWYVFMWMITLYVP